MGNVSSKNVLKRSGAIPEDEIWVTNEVGYAALHFNQHSLLPKHKKSISNCLKKRSQEEFLKPQPPLEFIQETKSMINSAIDLSDGLVGDLKHILNSSSVGAKIEINDIPMHKWFKENNQYELAMCGGEDYQILMTVPHKHHNKIQNLLKKHSLKGAMIGKITKNKKIEYSLHGKKIKLSKEGFTHFG
jgi:thiamine-monophosphate kinase